MTKKRVFKAARHYARLDHFLKESLPEISRAKIEKLIKYNRVELNGVLVARKNREIVPGDVAIVEFVEPEKKEYIPTRELKILYEDDYLLIIDKPPGISVHPGAGERGETILDIFTYYYPRVKEIKDSDRPGIVHRLDKETSGVLILARNEQSMKNMQQAFKRREVKKCYLALVSGRMRQRSGTIDAPITRSRRDRQKFIVAHGENKETARAAVTDFSVIKEFTGFSFIKLFPITGRTHQLRVHLTHYGCPILGDKRYGRVGSFERLALHAYAVAFVHPITGRFVSVKSPLPQAFRDFLKKATANYG
ncbi:MAG: RluA family pseudouridine synthase [Candidatus Aminicenantes bacterium]|nr:RluA family pseudouridine synthase [Candidatus Aminicenantes bacterium]